MTRPHYHRTIRDANGATIYNATVALLVPGTETPLLQPVYANPAGSTERGTSWMSTDGLVDFYLEDPAVVDIQITPAGGEAPRLFRDQWVGDAENLTPEGLTAAGALAGHVPVADGDGRWQWGGVAGGEEGGVGVSKDSHTFTFVGAATPYVGTLRYYVEESVRITRIRVSAGVAPTGADLIVDVNHNEASIFDDPADRPRIVAGEHTGFVDPSTYFLTAGDYITVDIDQIGTTSPGAELTVQVHTETAEPPPVG